MYLDRILGTKTKVNLLATLIQNPRRTYVEKELAAECRASPSETNRQIADLVSAGLVTMQRMGRTKVYRINTAHFLHAPLKRLFLDLNKIYRDITDRVVRAAVRRNAVSCALLVGSAATGTVRSDLVSEPSDIDLVFLVAAQKEVKPLEDTLLRFISSEISDRYGIVLYPLVLSLPKYKQLLAAGKDPFILHVHAEGEVLHGTKP